MKRVHQGLCREAAHDCDPGLPVAGGVVAPPGLGAKPGVSNFDAFDRIEQGNRVERSRNHR